MSNEKQILQKLTDLDNKFTRIENSVGQIKLISFEGKNVLSLSETASYTNYSEDYIYRHRHEIGFSKPNSKNIFFEKSKIDAWLLRGSSKSNEEINREATRMVVFKKAHN